MHERRFSPSQASKLDDPERKSWLPSDEILAKLDLAPGQRVVDIGTGTGYFSLPIAEAVGKNGRVIAVDVAPEMLGLLQQKLVGKAENNIDCIAAEAHQTTVKAHSCDLVFLANIWHEIDDTQQTLAEAERILTSKGRIAILDWRHELESPPGPPQHHRVPLDRVVELLTCNHWRIVIAEPIAKYSYIVIATVPLRT